MDNGYQEVDELKTGIRIARNAFEGFASIFREEGPGKDLPLAALNQELANLMNFILNGGIVKKDFRISLSDELKSHSIVKE